MSRQARRSGRRVYGALVAFTIALTVLVVIVANGPPPPGTRLDEDRVLPPGAVGTVTREEGLRLYVQALNNQDLDGILALSGRATPSVVAGEARLRRWGGASIVLDTVDVRDGLTPVDGDAVLHGTSSKGEYRERLALTRVQGRWLVAVSSWFGATPYP